MVNGFIHFSKLIYQNKWFRNSVNARMQLCFHLLNAELSVTAPLKSKRIRASPRGVSNSFVTYEVCWNRVTAVRPIKVPLVRLALKHYNPYSNTLAWLTGSNN
jgi:hypothetical protein